LSKGRPIDEVLADPSVPARTKERLRLVREVRAWGEAEIGLARTDSYEEYVDLEGRPVSYLVTACAPDSLAPKTWWFPIVGSVPYLGFFDPGEAREESDRLRAGGWDVFVRPVNAYSTLGWFDDPVLSSFVDWPPHRVADTILHETTHATVWIPGEVAFNESLADFVGGAAAARFVSERFGPDSPEAAAAAAEDAEDALFRDFMNRLRADLARLYDSGLPSSEKVALKAAAFRLHRARFRSLKARFARRGYRDFDLVEWNNAIVAALAVYDSDRPTWERLLAAVGGDLRRFLAAVKTAAAATDPRAEIERMAGGR
jgi:predicted aminopeptidase